MRRILTLTLAVCGVMIGSSAATFGVVSSTGDFRVDGSPIRGNGTVFEGSVIETASARSNVQLGSYQVTLLPDSRLKAFKDRAVLEKGWGIVQQGTLEAATFRIALAKGSSAIVQMTAPKSINVVAQTGDAQVRTAQGVLVASVRAGMGMAFTAQAPAASQAAVMQLAGKVSFANGKCTLTEATKPPITYELVGWANCSANNNAVIKVQGTLSNPGVVQVKVETIAAIKEAEAAKIAALGTGAAAVSAAAAISGSAVAVAAGTAAAVATGTALGTGAIVAIGGAAAAGIAAGTVAATTSVF